MPIFEYRCLKCLKKFEKLVLKEEQIECPECGSVEVRKLISSFSSPNAQGGTSCSSCSAKSCAGCGTSS